MWTAGESNRLFVTEEVSELKTVNIKLTMEMFPSSVFETFNFELLKVREISYEN